MAKVKLRMAIDPFKVLDHIAEKVGGKLAGKKLSAWITMKRPTYCTYNSNWTKR